MERLAKKIAKSVGDSLGKTEEEVAVIAYGLIGILQFSAIFIVASIIGAIFGFWLEVLTVFLSVGFLRRFTGGAHSSGLYSCLVYSVFFVCGISSLARYALVKLPFVVICIVCGLIFLYGYLMIALKAPVAPPNKPCRSEAKRKRLRKGAFTALSAFLIFVFCALIFRGSAWRLYTVGLALSLSALWQITMMTKLGHKFITFIDGLFTSKKSQ